MAFAEENNNEENSKIDKMIGINYKIPYNSFFREFYTNNFIWVGLDLGVGINLSKNTKLIIEIANNYYETDLPENFSQSSVLISNIDCIFRYMHPVSNSTDFFVGAGCGIYSFTSFTELIRTHESGKLLGTLSAIQLDLYLGFFPEIGLQYRNFELSALWEIAYNEFDLSTFSLKSKDNFDGLKFRLRYIF